MAVFTQQVSSIVNDAHEKDDGTSFNSTDPTVSVITSTTSSLRSNGGFRFTNVTIPNGDNIVSAVLDVYPVNSTSDSPKLHIYCEDVDDSANFTDTPDVTSRARTTANTAWSAVNVGFSTYVTSPDFASSVQEVVDRAGWASGNDLMVLFIGDNNSSISNIQVASADNINAATQSAVITIVHEADPVVWQEWGETAFRSIDADDYGGATLFNAFLEVHGFASASGETFFRLWNDTTDTVVAGSVCSTTSTTKVRVRSDAFALAAGANTYHIEFGAISTQSPRMFDGVLILEPA